MIKRTIIPPSAAATREEDWIRLEEAAEVEITSETEANPIEAALVAGDERGWRAETPGEQIVRLRFAEPRRVNQVRLVIEERERERTQEFVLRAAAEANGPWREVVRQQFTFSPGGATREQEDYRLNLPRVAALELKLVPDIRGGDARASLRQLRLA